jgi:ATP-dependent Clp protease ATP-binding subunit ClpX
MSDKEIKHCSFCGIAQSPTVPLIAGSEGYICGDCVLLANQVVSNWSRKKELSEMQGPLPIPAKIKAHLDKFCTLLFITITNDSSMKAVTLG